MTKRRERLNVTRQEREAFAILPREFSVKPGKHGLSIIETALLAGILRAAVVKRHRRRDKRAHMAGLRALVKYKRSGGKNEKRARALAREAHAQSMSKQKAAPKTPLPIKVELSPTQLFKLAGLSADTRSLRKLADALTALKRISLPRRSTLLKTHRAMLNGKHRLSVRGDWLGPPWVKVPIPLTTKSLTAINLLLFLRCISDGGHIRLKSLATDVLALKTRKPFEQRRLVDRALWIVNERVSSIKDRNLFARNEVPYLYVIRIEKDRVRFGQARASWDDHEETEKHQDDRVY